MRRVWLTGVVAASVLAVGAGTLPSQAASGRVSAAATDYTSVMSTLDSEIPQLMKQYKTVGLSFALVDGNTVVAAKGYGFADKQAGVPVTADTLFHIGSVSKTLTATAVMQLVEQGRIDLDAPLSMYVPEFSLLPRYKGNVITVRDVLTHTSGIPGDVFNGLITQGTPDPGFRGWLLNALRKMYPERRVNTMEAYNNSGFVLLQDVVEKVTGQPFADYTRTVLFGPLGMPRSTFDDRVPAAAEITSNYALTYNRKGQPNGTTREPREYVNGWTAGSVLSSAGDMANYLQMLVSQGQGVSGAVLKAGTLNEMLTQQHDLPLDIVPTQTGLSWFLVPDTWRGFTFTHDGATGYNFTSLTVLRDSRLAVYVSANTIGGIEVTQLVSRRALNLAYTAKTGIEEPAPAPLPTRAFDPPTKAYIAKHSGVVATTTGYDLLRPDGRKLRWVQNADSASPNPVTLRRMGNGWWATKKSDELQVRFRTVKGRRLIVGRIPSSSGIQTYTVGERADPQGTLPTAWKQRLGSYMATNIVKGNMPGFAPKRIRLERADGVLVLVRHPLPTQVLRPVQKRAAFSYGSGPSLGRGKGNGLIPHGRKLSFMGVTYKPA